MNRYDNALAGFFIHTNRRRTTAMDQKLQGQIRTLLAALAGISATLGWTSTAQSGIIVGAGMLLVTSLWSWKSKK